MDSKHRLLTPALLVATLGYFVDVYDLVLFIVLKNPSLTDLGVPHQDLLSTGVSLLDTQMLGMLVGGIVWGVLGDKIGRTQVLFGSIVIYSLANITNAFVHSVPSYHLYRALAGFGLAGELGAGVTLVAETLPIALRGYGTTIIATVGISGAVVAGLMGEFLPWRYSYIAGGLLGLVLLVVRVSVTESHLFVKATQDSKIPLGSIKLLLCNRDRLFRYLLCILLGTPTWFVVGILMANAIPLAQALGVTGVPKQAYALIWCYTGIMFGDGVAGFISQRLKSRKKPMALYLFAGLLLPIWFLTDRGISINIMYLHYALLGFASGFWVLTVTSAAEQFGTNIRATVTTTIPNFIRASVIPMNIAFLWLQGRSDIITAALVVGVVTSSIALLSLLYLKETFHRELDFVDS